MAVPAAADEAEWSSAYAEVAQRLRRSEEGVQTHWAKHKKRMVAYFGTPRNGQPWADSAGWGEENSEVRPVPVVRGLVAPANLGLRALPSRPSYADDAPPWPRLQYASTAAIDKTGPVPLKHDGPAYVLRLPANPMDAAAEQRKSIGWLDSSV